MVDVDRIIKLENNIISGFVRVGQRLAYKMGIIRIDQDSRGI